MTFNNFNSHSMKARIFWVQRVLVSNGYSLKVNGKRDRDTVKALSKFQKSNGLAGNAVVCDKTFDLLLKYGGDCVSIKLN